jgi:dTDP-4-amino-4,6-dideoxygalactose transaminase
LLHRKKISTLYEAEFNADDLKRFNVSKSSENVDISYSRFPILVKNKESILIEAKKDKVEIASFFDTPIHPLPEKELHLVDYEAGSCPNSEDLCKQLISFPINSKIDVSAVKKIATYINRKAE